MRTFFAEALQGALFFAALGAIAAVCWVGAAAHAGPPV